jgi:hypothetical protein
MTGSGYTIGNRRLHIYFFSTRTWQRKTAPLAALDKFKETLQKLEQATDEDEKVRLEHELLNNLQVYDFAHEEKDAFVNQQKKKSKL